MSLKTLQESINKLKITPNKPFNQLHKTEYYQRLSILYHLFNVSSGEGGERNFFESFLNDKNIKNFIQNQQRLLNVNNKLIENM